MPGVNKPKKQTKEQLSVLRQQHSEVNSKITDNFVQFASQMISSSSVFPEKWSRRNVKWKGQIEKKKKLESFTSRCQKEL